MERLISALLLCAMLLPLAACGGSGGTGSTTITLGPEVTIYGNGVVPVLITPASISSAARELAMTIRGTLRTKLGETPRMAADAATEKNEIEIVFGDTNRPISAQAKFLLPEQEGDEAAYAIYFDGDGAAIVWNHDYAAEVGLQYFSDNYLTADVL